MRLRDLGNTVIVVEHDEETIRVADHVVDIGPGAGEHGGEIVVVGHASTTCSPSRGRSPASTSPASGTIPVPELPAATGRRSGSRSAARASTTCSDIDVEFPLGCFVAVTGVSGSGKSTLVNDILFHALMQKVYRSRTVPGRHKRHRGRRSARQGHQHRPVADRAHAPFEPRHLHRRVRQDPHAVRGDAGGEGARLPCPGRFSFNVKGGRCEACAGDGTIKIEMHFLPDVYVPCEVCKGARYNRDTLDITFKGKNIAEVLDMPCEEALEFFANQPTIARQLQTLVDVGLGYVRLGQPRADAVGRRGAAGEAREPSSASARPGSTIYILDEPTTGLHFEDVRRLLGVLQRLVDTGNTVLVIEHNLDVIKTRRLDHRPRARRRRRRRHGHRRRHARERGQGAREPHRAVPREVLDRPKPKAAVKPGAKARARLRPASRSRREPTPGE